MPLTSAYWPVPFTSVVQSVFIVVLLLCLIKTRAEDEDSVPGPNSSQPLFQPTKQPGNLGADGRIRTGDPLFTNQAAIEFSVQFWFSMYSKDVHEVQGIPFCWLQKTEGENGPRPACWYLHLDLDQAR